MLSSSSARRLFCPAFIRRFSTSVTSTSKNDDASGGKEPFKMAGSVVEEYKNPWYILANDFKNFGKKPEKLPVPRETDILVIGGGAMGSSVAYWLKQRNPNGFNLHVVEKDPTYTRAATVLSVGGIRQQFSLPENIEMSMFGADFIRNIKEHLGVYGHDPPDIQFNPQGYLFLASEQGIPTMESNHKIQTDHGAKVALMSPTELKEKFPWLNVDDVAMGSYGLENEGWFDPWLLLAAMRNKAASLKAQYVKGEVVGFKHREEKIMGSSGTVQNRKILEQALIKAEDGLVYPMKFAACVNCAGPWAGEVAKMAGIGVDEGPLEVSLPIEPRKRYVYVVHCPDGPGLEMPLVIDHTGVYIRREGLGGYYICGTSPSPEETSHDDYEVDPVYFKEKVLPVLVHRIPAFKNLKVKSAWAGYYDYNYFDQNLIIGTHPYHRNMMFATGCSGHGIQQSPAIGRAVMELIIDDEYQTIDLSRLGFDRMIEAEPLFESNIV